MGRHTPLLEVHRSLGARIVDFAGWDMPAVYRSQIEEHHAVRRTAGVFDVSHMCVIDIEGGRSRPLLARLLANDVGRLKLPGKALYSCMLDDSGGVRDDLIVYFRDESRFRIVVNAGTRDADLEWIGRHARDFGVAVQERADLAILAVQGPVARERTAGLLSVAAAQSALALEPFFGRDIDGWFIARTGYTGEDGFEIMLPAAAAPPLWRALNALDVTSCGLGARDTLRLEAGMNLYGNDMTAATHPFESGLGWTVALEPAARQFIGRPALEAVRARGAERRLVGLVLEDRGVMRAHQSVQVAGEGIGEITSGGFSPTLERSIALARVPAGTATSVAVEVRGKSLAARIVKPPFVRLGKSLIGD